MNRGSPPSEIAEQLPHSLLDQFFYKTKDEWAGPCPQCGGNDRFVIFPAHKNRRYNVANGWCRKCGHTIFPDKSGNPGSIDPAVAAHFAQLRQNRERAQQQRLERLQKADFWRRWHDDMTTAQKQLWFDRGVGEWALPTHKLGYRPGADKEALTIPYLREDERIVSLQFRLLCPHEGGKYRFINGLNAQWFLPWPHDDLAKAEIVVVVEGAIKSMVLLQAVGEMAYRGYPITIVATPSVYVPEDLMPELDNARRVIWILDPDAYEPGRNGSRTPIARNIELVGRERSLVVRTIDKIDDLIVQRNWPAKTIQAMIRQAGPYLGA